MSESIVPPVEIEIGGKKLRLRYSKNRFLYRFPDQAGKGAGANIVDLLWALADPCPFHSPENLAEVVFPAMDSDEKAKEIGAAINRAIEAGTKPDDQSPTS